MARSTTSVTGVHENESDEWVEIENTGSEPADLTGWQLKDEEGDGHTYHLPDGFTLEPSSAVKVRSGSGQDTETDLYWGRDAAVWDNSGDTARLFDESGSLVDSKSWP